MSQSNTIHAVIYSNSTIVNQLNVEPFSNLIGDLIVETSTEPNMAVALGLETPLNFPGVAGISNGKITLKDLSVNLKELSVPIVLASGKAVSNKVLNTAIGLLPDTEYVGQITVFIHVQELEPIRFALAYVDKLSVVWDLADLPTESLTDLSDFLEKEGLLTSDFWGGFYPYKSSSRAYDENTIGTMEKIFEPYATA